MKLKLKCTNCGNDTTIELPDDSELIACPCCGSSVDPLEIEEEEDE